MTNQKHSSVPAISRGASTHHSLNALVHKQEYSLVGPKPDYTRQYLMQLHDSILTQHKLEAKRRQFAPTVSSMHYYSTQ